MKTISMKDTQTEKKPAATRESVLAMYNFYKYIFGPDSLPPFDVMLEAAKQKNPLD